MRFLLAAINAKYIHSNLAIYSLRAFAEAAGHPVELAEYTINHQKEEILRDIYVRKPDVIGFSCYIWNLRFVEELTEELHQIMPEVPLWLGGPEVSWNPEDRLLQMPQITGIMVGEGEETMAELAGWYADRIETGTDSAGKMLKDIAGLCIRDGMGNPVRTGTRPILSMDRLVFPYRNLSDYENRIIYYESSRGCPFSCSYCLSSVEKKLRFRSLSLVFQELDFFLKGKVDQVKFVDRTFNCRHEHAHAIWNYIHEHDNGVTNFHFEISADLLKEEDIELFSKMRPGLIQLETGVQTTNPDTLRAIGRNMDIEKVAANTEKVRKLHNIHQHLDLIAGLPHEGLESFSKSFDDVYAMKPDQLQLGFLKVLHGTRMEKEADIHGLVYRKRPVYEVLSTRWLSYEDVLVLKNVEETVEDYYNSGQFTATLSWVMKYFNSPFRFFREFGDFLRQNGYRSANQNRIGKYMALRIFLQEHFLKEESGFIDELLTFDFCLREKLNRVPAFVPDQSLWKKQIADFFAQEIKEGRWFGEDASKSSYRQLRGRCQPLIFRNNIEKIYFCNKKDKKETQNGDTMQKELWLAIFDYDRRDALNHNAEVIWVPFTEQEEACEK